MADISLCCLSGFAHCFRHSTELRAASMVAYDSVITSPMSLFTPRVKKKRKLSSRTTTFTWQQMHSNHPIYKIRICRNIIVDHNFPAESQSDVVTWIKNLLEDTNCLPLHLLQSIVRVKGKSKSYLLLRDEVLHRGSCGCLELPITGMNRFFKSNNVPNWTTTAATQRGGQELLKCQMLP